MSKEYKKGFRDAILYNVGGLAWVAIIMKAIAIMLMT